MSHEIEDQEDTVPYNRTTTVEHGIAQDLQHGEIFTVPFHMMNLWGGEGYHKYKSDWNRENKK
jgi:hypothetical protein